MIPNLFTLALLFSTLYKEQYVVYAHNKITMEQKKTK